MNYTTKQDPPTIGTIKENFMPIPVVTHYMIQLKLIKINFGT